jgi:hypothetical protein
MGGGDHEVDFKIFCSSRFEIWWILGSHIRGGEMWRFKYSSTLRLVNSYDVLVQRSTFVCGVCQLKIQRIVTTLFIVVVAIVFILGVLYINFIVIVSGQDFFQHFVWWGTRWRSWLRVWSPMCSLRFFIGLILLAVNGPRVDSASNRANIRDVSWG